MNKKRIGKILCMILSINFISSINPMIVKAEEMSVYDRNRMLGANALEWQSSNIREWLNSDKDIVDYTSLKPSYKDETGFLSNSNFTQKERDGIAITKHAGSYTYRGSNINDTLYLSQRSVARNDYIYNDKVFILNFTDIVNYIEKNKELLNLNKKYYSNYLQQQTNRKDKYDYLVNGGYVGGYWLMEATMYTSTLRDVKSREAQNIVPALSLKPDYVLSNGIKAKDLVVGSIVTFGKYNGEPIEWQVINKDDNGYPLLWSTKILSIKEYDAPGDLNPNNSKVINYNSYDVDLTNGNGQIKSWETKTNIKSSPVINIENEKDLTTPTNNTSITLKIKVTDEHNDIRKMILPDGTIVNGNYAEWTLHKNGEYDIIAENSQGIITVRHIITKAINTPSEVTVTTDKNNDTKWTNKPVNVTVSATNNGVYIREAKANKNMGYGTLSVSGFPNWMSLGGKKIRIKGTLKNALSDEDYKKINPEMFVNIRFAYKWYTNNIIGWSWPCMTGVKLKDLKEKGKVDIDYIYTFPDNVYECNSIYTELSNGSETKKEPYNYWASDFTFELLDKDDLKIESITLPDGNIVYDDHVTYSIFKNGSYTFLSKDNRNKITSKTIDLAIDTIKPNLDISGIGSNIVKNEVIHIKATDDLSGIKSIKLPNGEYRTNNEEGKPLEIEYNLVKNGTYTFETTDFAGNTTSKSITINNIDDEAPVLNFSVFNEWTGKNYKIELSAIDKLSGVESITLSNGEVVHDDEAIFYANENKLYRFVVTDKLGNSKAYTYEVNKIDNIKPELNISTSNNMTNVDKEITIKANDGQSGISHIILPNGNLVKGNTAKYTVSKNGDISILAVDKAGNTTTKSIHIDTIDKNNPNVKIINNKEWSNKNKEIKIIASDN